MKKICLSSLSLLIGLAVLGLARQGGKVAEIELLRKHVGYLASEELEGRRTGARGANEAAAYISKQFHTYGLGCPAPGLQCRNNGGKERGREKGYLQEFPYVAAVEPGKNNSLRLKLNGRDVVAQLGEEWMPLGYSANGKIDSAEVVLVGHGITAAEQRYDDYANLNAKGRIAIAFAGTPDGDNPHGQFARFTESRWKAIAAKDHGAAALFVVVREEKFRDDRLSKMVYDQTLGEAGLPVIAISRQIAAKLFRLTDTSHLTEIEKDAGKRPAVAQALANVRTGVSAEIERHTVAGYNVIGVIEGGDRKGEYIVIGAHYDHLGRGDQSSRSPNSNEVHHGADDNASGVAGLLELARIFASQRQQLRRSLILIAFSGEESGLIGSHHYVNNSFAPHADTIAMINMDMIGRLRDNKLTIGGVGTSQEFRSLVESANAALDPAQRFTLQLNEDGFGPSDHSSFYAKRVPVLFFFTGTHEDYHKPSDTPLKINYEGEARIVAYVADLVRRLDRSDNRPTYAVAQSSGATGGRSGGFRVYLGTIPSYAESNDGLSLEGVRDDSPAARAGLKAGDKIVKLAGREIKNVYDYTYALGEMKPDQEYEVEVLRRTERLQLKITPQLRK
jgi:Peptidase family M28/PDZ domain